MTTGRSAPAGRVLVVDDDDALREVVRYALDKAGFEVLEAADGEAARARFAQIQPDLVVLDVAMPKLDGLSFCRELRTHSTVPILFLSARKDEVDRMLGLDLGGDDYVTKPFSTRELVSRVRALLRRSAGPVAPKALTWGPLRVLVDEHRVVVGDAEIELTATEFRLLAALLGSGTQVLGRHMLAAAAYPDDRTVSDRTIDSHVRRVRAKLRPFGLDPFVTVHGVGFRLADAP